MPFIPTKEYVSIAKAAKILDVKRYAVLAAIARQDLEAITVAERAVITRASLNAYILKRQEYFATMEAAND